MENKQTFTKEEVFNAILKRRKELEKRIANPEEGDTKEYLLSLKVRWNEIGNILDVLDYEAYQEEKDDLDELLR